MVSYKSEEPLHKIRWSVYEATRVWVYFPYALERNALRLAEIRILLSDVLKGD